MTSRDKWGGVRGCLSAGGNINQVRKVHYVIITNTNLKDNLYKNKYN